MRPCVEHSQGRSADFPDHLLDRDEIPQRLVHLLSLNTQQASVEPITRQRLLPGQALSLSNLCLVMWKDQLRPTTMNIIRWPEVRQRDRGILYVPAWSSFSPRTVPEYLARFVALPQCKISRMLFPRIGINPVNPQIFKLLVGKFPIAWKLRNIKVDITVNSVRETLLEQSCDLVDDLGNMIRSVRIEVYAFHMQILHVFKE